MAQAPDSHTQLVTANKGGKRIAMQVGPNAVSTSSTSFTNLTADFITIPATQSGVLFLTFSAESQVTGGGAGQWCSVRFTVDGVEAKPTVGQDFAFDSVESGGTDDFWESNSVQRVSQVIGPGGSHTVAVDFAVTSGATTCRLDDWLATAQFWRQ